MFPLDSPSSPLAKLEIQLPPGLPSDPFSWDSNQVSTFFDFCEREFDLKKFDRESVRMNGKAICMLTSSDLAEFATPSAGMVVHNVLQTLITESLSNKSIVTPSCDQPQQMPQQSASESAENSQKSNFDESQNSQSSGEHNNSLLTVLYKESTTDESESSEFYTSRNHFDLKPNSLDSKYDVRVKIEPIPFELEPKSGE